MRWAPFLQGLCELGVGRVPQQRAADPVAEPRSPGGAVSPFLFPLQAHVVSAPVGLMLLFPSLSRSLNPAHPSINSPSSVTLLECAISSPLGP